jgi:hypothetical protein
MNNLGLVIKDWPRKQLRLSETDIRASEVTSAYRLAQSNFNLVNHCWFMRDISMGAENMFEELTMSELRSRIEQHLLMVEEVLGGMDTFILRLEKRVARVEEGLGLEPEGISSSGWVADLGRAKTELSAMRNLVK